MGHPPYVLNFFTGQHSPVYWAELMGIWAFAVYWLVKTKEMLGPDIEKLIAGKGVKAVI